MKYWIFDLDGTLVDSFSHYFVALSALLERSLSIEEKRMISGMHVSQVLSEKFGPAEIEQAAARLRATSLENAKVIQPFDSIELVMKTLKDQDRRVAVWTSRDRASAQMVLDSTGLSHYVEKLVSGDCVQNKKPHTEGLRQLQAHFSCEPHDMVMIGDHDFDMKAGREFGAKAIRASWHRQWDDGICSLANHQFSEAIDFQKWILTNQ